MLIYHYCVPILCCFALQTLGEHMHVYCINLVEPTLRHFIPAGITILESPTNTTAIAGERVTFRCRFSGTQDLPLWSIGETTFSSYDLPTGFEYTEEGLRIRSVWESLNNTKFTCLFIVHIGGGRLSRIESSAGYLVVHSISRHISNDSMNQSTHSMTTVIPTTENTISSTVMLNTTSITNGPRGELPITQCASIATSNEASKFCFIILSELF